MVIVGTDPHARRVAAGCARAAWPPAPCRRRARRCRAGWLRGGSCRPAVRHKSGSPPGGLPLLAHHRVSDIAGPPDADRGDRGPSRVKADKPPGMSRRLSPRQRSARMLTKCRPIRLNSGSRINSITGDGPDIPATQKTKPGLSGVDFRWAFLPARLRIETPRSPVRTQARGADLSPRLSACQEPDRVARGRQIAPTHPGRAQPAFGEPTSPGGQAAARLSRTRLPRGARLTCYRPRAAPSEPSPWPPQLASHCPALPPTTRQGREMGRRGHCPFIYHCGSGFFLVLSMPNVTFPDDLGWSGARDRKTLSGPIICSEPGVVSLSTTWSTVRASMKTTLLQREIASRRGRDGRRRSRSRR